MSKAFNLANDDEEKAHAAAIFDRISRSAALSCRRRHREEKVRGLNLVSVSSPSGWRTVVRLRQSTRRARRSLSEHFRARANFTRESFPSSAPRPSPGAIHCKCAYAPDRASCHVACFTPTFNQGRFHNAKTFRPRCSLNFVVVVTAASAQTFEKNNYNYSEWAKGRFSEAVTVTGPGQMIFLARVGAENENGQAGDILNKGDVVGQCKYAFDKIKRALDKNGAGLGDIVKMVTYLTDMKIFGRFRQVPPGHIRNDTYAGTYAAECQSTGMARNADRNRRHGDGAAKIAAIDTPLRPVPGLLTSPNGEVASGLKWLIGKFILFCFELLQAHDVWFLGQLQPVQQVWKPLVDVVDVEGRDLRSKAPGPSRSEQVHKGNEKGLS